MIRFKGSKSHSGVRLFVLPGWETGGFASCCSRVAVISSTHDLLDRHSHIRNSRSLFSTSPALSHFRAYDTIIITPNAPPVLARASMGPLDHSSDVESQHPSEQHHDDYVSDTDDGEDTQVRQGLLAHTQHWQHQQQQLVLGSSLPAATAIANGVSSGPTAAAVSEGRVRTAYNLSWAVNILLFGAKIYAFYVSHSKAVLASMVDSIVDLVSQAVIFLAEHLSKKADPRFPVGRARLEALGVLACACIMSISAYEVIQLAGLDLYNVWGQGGDIPVLNIDAVLYVVLGSATILKVICYAVCVGLQKQSDSMAALAEDHLNDVMSNVAAMATASVAVWLPRFWYTDPVAGIVISLVIVWRWLSIAQNQVDKLTGRGAPPDFIEQLQVLASQQQGITQVDCIRAYHFGPRFIVEMEIVMPQETPLKLVHDISLTLQHKLEALDEVERAFVHCDYQHRDEPEHKVERRLQGLLPTVLEEHC
ncbi:MAG: hypothetical protein WDW38_010975 [Sanguina aurantia]